MRNKKYMIGFSTDTGMPMFWVEYADAKEAQRIIKEHIILNDGNEHSYLVVSEEAYRNLRLGLDKTSELFWVQDYLFEASQSLQEAMKTIKEVIDKP